MSIIRIRGAAMTDSMFTTDKAVLGFEISWNITRIQRDADAGFFGVPTIIAMSQLPPMSSLANANIDWEKVSGMIQAHDLNPAGSVVSKPALQVAAHVLDTLYRITVDGNHRICARRIIGYANFSSYVVPEDVECDYRITEEVLDG